MVTVSYFPLQAAQNSVPVLKAMIRGLEDMGVRCVANSWDADAVILWSVLWAGRMKANREVYEAYQRTGRPVIVVDVGALHRNVTWKIAVDHVTANGYYGHQQDLDPDRPRRLGVTLGEMSNRNSRIIIAAQHSDSHQLDGVDYRSWLTDVIYALRSYTDREIVIRPHPRSRLDLVIPRDVSGVSVRSPNRLLSTYDNYDLDFSCHAMVNYNSGVGIQAALAGCPCLVDASSLAEPVSISIENIESPEIPDREQWCIEICHTEYLLEEIEQALWVKRLKEKLWND